MRFLFILFLLLIVTQLFCQIDFYIETDETIYSYGQDIYITFNLHNTTADTIFVEILDIFPFSYYIDDEYFPLGSMPGVFELFMSPYSTYSENYIHTDNINVGDHNLIGEFNDYLLSEPISISIEQVSIESAELHLIDFKLSNSPNPFNPFTTINFSIQNDSDVEISIYNIRGQKIKTLVQNEYTKGLHSIIWNGNNESGKSISSGVYYYKLKVNKKTEVIKKCLMLK